MKDTDIQIGRFCNIKVVRNTTAVRVMQEFADGKGGWDATTVSGDKDIIIRSASRIVGEYIPKVNSAIIDSKPGKPTHHQICEAFDNAPKRLSLLNATAKVP